MAIADFLGIHRTALYRWIKGESLPTRNRLIKLSTLLEIPVSALTDESAPVPPPKVEAMALGQAFDSIFAALEQLPPRDQEQVESLVADWLKYRNGAVYRSPVLTLLGAAEDATNRGMSPQASAMARLYDSLPADFQAQMRAQGELLSSELRLSGVASQQALAAKPASATPKKAPTVYWPKASSPPPAASKRAKG